MIHAGYHTQQEGIISVSIEVGMDRALFGKIHLEKIVIWQLAKPFGQ